jgi:hypothetical protein
VGALDAEHAEDVTAAMLGASEWQAQAFRSAVFSHVLRFWVTEREAIAAIWNSGAWQERTAEDADEQLDLADRLTGEGGAREVPPFPTPASAPQAPAVQSARQAEGVQEGAVVI